MGGPAVTPDHPPIEAQITFLGTTDLAATARFYEDVMGFRLAVDQGDCRIYQVGRDGYLGFCRRGSVAPEAGWVIFTLVTPEVDAWHAYLAARGVTFEKPPQLNAKYGIYHCFLRDPNGYLIEIQRFTDPQWSD